METLNCIRKAKTWKSSQSYWCSLVQTTVFILASNVYIVVIFAHMTRMYFSLKVTQLASLSTIHWPKGFYFWMRGRRDLPLVASLRPPHPSPCAIHAQPTQYFGYLLLHHPPLSFIFWSIYRVFRKHILQQWKQKITPHPGVLKTFRSTFSFFNTLPQFVREFTDWWKNWLYVSKVSFDGKTETMHLWWPCISHVSASLSLCRAGVSKLVQSDRKVKPVSTLNSGNGRSLTSLHSRKLSNRSSFYVEYSLTSSFSLRLPQSFRILILVAFCNNLVIHIFIRTLFFLHV